MTETPKIVGSGNSTLSPVVSLGIGTVGPPALITLQVTSDMLATLQGMSRDAGQPLDIVFTRAIGLYREALRATSEGNHVGYAASPDVLDVEFTGLAGPGTR